MFNVDDAIPAHWSQGKVEIRVYVFKECPQTFELKKLEDTKGADKAITNSL